MSHLPHAATSASLECDSLSLPVQTIWKPARTLSISAKAELWKALVAQVCGKLFLRQPRRASA
eukprot:8220067-Pyramimonas_sp.AAC.1